MEETVGRFYRKTIIKELVGSLKGSENVMVFSFSGIVATNLGKLRMDLKDKQAHFLTTKNQFIKKALAEVEKEKLNEVIEGQTALLFFGEEPIEGTKVISKFIKDNPGMLFKAGFLGERFLEEKDFNVLASLPTRDELLARAVMTIKGPITSTVLTLRGIINKFVLVLKAVKQNKEQEKEPDEAQSEERVKEESKEEAEASKPLNKEQAQEVEEEDKEAEEEVKKEDETQDEEQKQEQNKEQNKEE